MPAGYIPGRGGSSVTKPLVDEHFRRVSNELQGWLNWLDASNAKGVVEELGWTSTADVTAWNAFGDSYYQLLDQRKLPSVAWTAGRTSRDYPLGVYVAHDASTVLDTAKPTAVIHEKHFNLDRGVALVDAIVNADTNGDNVPDSLGAGVFSNLNPGTRGTDYWYPSLGDFQYLASRGVGLVRLMFRWERLQRTLGGALDSGEVTAITAALDAAGQCGVRVVLSMFNQGGYILGSSTSVAAFSSVSKLGSTVTSAHLSDCWSRIATAFGGNQALHGYSLMNEPHTTSEATTTGSNLYVNPGAETDLTGVTGDHSTVTRVTTGQLTGSAAFKVTADGTGTPALNVTGGIGVTPGQKYLFSAKVKALSTQRQMSVLVNWQGGSPDFAYLSTSFGEFPLSNTAGYVTVAGIFTAPAGAAFAGPEVQISTTVPSGEAFLVDDVQFYATTASYTGPKLWEVVSQDAVNAIRTVESNHEIWVAGFQGQSPRTMITDHPTGWIVDSARRFRYAAHHYFDLIGGSFGFYGDTYANELAASVAVTSADTAPASAKNTAGLIARDETPLAVGNSTTATTLKSLTLPGGTAKQGDRFMFRVSGDYLNNSGSNATLTFAMHFGGITLTGASNAYTTNASRRGWWFDLEATVIDTATVHLRVRGGVAAAGTTLANDDKTFHGTLGSQAVDLTGDVAITLVGTNATAAATIEVKAFEASLERLAA